MSFPPEQLENSHLNLAIDPSMILHVFFRLYIKRGHPFHQVFISAVVLHEFHEFVEKNSLGSFHKMWSHCWLEILYSSSVWLSKFISIKQSFEDRCFSFQSVPEGWPPLFRFQFCYQSSIAFSNANHEVFPSKPGGANSSVRHYGRDS